MAQAITARDAAPGRSRKFRFDREHRHRYLREQMSRRAGMVCYTAPPPILREHGLGIYRMRRGGSYVPLVESHPRGDGCFDGEVQLVDDFDRDVSTALRARRDVLDDDAPHRVLAGPGADDALRWAIHDRKAALDATRSRRRS
jgi:hypothetical protein